MRHEGFAAVWMMSAWSVRSGVWGGMLVGEQDEVNGHGRRKADPGLITPG